MAIYSVIILAAWLEEEYPTQKGKITLIGDCETAIKRVFHKGPIGVKDATQDEYDLILAIRKQLQALQITVSP